MTVKGSRTQWAFSRYDEAVYWVKQIQRVEPRLNVQIEDPRWGTGEWVVVVRLNDKLADLLGLKHD